MEPLLKNKKLWEQEWGWKCYVSHPLAKSSGAEEVDKKKVLEMPTLGPLRVIQEEVVMEQVSFPQLNSC